MATSVVIDDNYADYTHDNDNETEEHPLITADDDFDLKAEKILRKVKWTQKNIHHNNLLYLHPVSHFYYFIKTLYYE